MKKSRHHLIYDPFVISRVKQYLEENTHQTHVNVGDMARALQDKYRDYNRRKTAPFRQLVEHAYQIVLKSYGLGSNTNSDIEDDLSDGSIELLDEERETNGPGPNLLGDVMNSLYNKKVPANPENNNNMECRQGQMNTEAAPIDISSDDGEDDELDCERCPRPVEQLDVGTNKTSAPSTLDKELPNGVNAMKIVEKRLNHNLNEEFQQVGKKRKINPIQAPALSVIKAGASSSSASSTKKTPTVKKDFPLKTSTLTFADVGGIDKILKELCELLLHLKHPELYEYIGLSAPRGFLLHGPPGSGKTLLANAIAGQLQVPLIEVAATELVAGISGESEERIREVFEKAASVAPCVLFIDEVDVVSANRNNAQKDLERRIVSQLLSSLDGLCLMPNGKKVVVVGATNRADSLDPALRRVGRFDQEICLGIPDRTAREQILKIVCKPLRLEEPFSFDELAVLTPGFVGADLLALAMRAATVAVRRAFSLRTHSPPTTEDVPITVDNDVAQVEPTINSTEAQPTSSDEPQKMDVDTSVEVKSTEPEGGDGDGDKEIQPDDGTKVDEQDKPEAVEMSKPDVEVSSQPEEQKRAEIVVPKVGEYTLEEMMDWLCSKSGTWLTKETIESLRVTMGDFKAALAVVQPSAKREGFITVPDVTWDDIGSLGEIRNELKMSILAPIKYPKKLERLGLQSPSGVLLCGPPGCGKTLLAKAIANEAGINFISVKGPELLNMYVGESERAVRQCFQRAKNSAPCVIFFDEFDALCPKRSSRSDGSSSARIVNQLLTEMDGVEDRRGVFLMAATNRPDMIDGAVLRPGRLDKILYVGLPEVEDRKDILRALTKGGTKPPLGSDVQFGTLAELTSGFTGADLGGLVREASIQSLKESLVAATTEQSDEENLVVGMQHFYEALKNIKPSVTDDDKRHYQRLQKMYGNKEDTADSLKV